MTSMVQTSCFYLVLFLITMRYQMTFSREDSSCSALCGSKPLICIGQNKRFEDIIYQLFVHRQIIDKETEIVILVCHTESQIVLG